MATKTEPCIHDLDPAGCAFCSGHDPERRIPSHSPGHAIPARFPGHCSGCGEQIMPGDPIHPDPAGGGWVCEECS